MEEELVRRAIMYRKRIQESDNALEKRFYEGKLAAIEDMMYLLKREKK